MWSVYVVLLVLFVNANAGNVWLKDLISPKGWNLGYGVILKLNESHKGKHLPIMERLSLDLNLGELVGVSVGKARSEGIELDFYVKKNVDYQEGRGKKNNEGKYIIPMMMGYKAVMLISAMFAAIKVLSLKAVLLAKVALIISIAVLLTKLKHHEPPEIIEFEQHGYPVHSSHYIDKDAGYHRYGGSYSGGYGGGGIGYGYGREAQASHLYQDIVYAPSAQGSASGTADSNAGYSAATVNNSPTSGGITSKKGQEIERKRDSSFYRRMRGVTGNGSLLSVKKFSSAET